MFQTREVCYNHGMEGVYHRIMCGGHFRSQPQLAAIEFLMKKQSLQSAIKEFLGSPELQAPRNRHEIDKVR